MKHKILIWIIVLGIAWVASLFIFPLFRASAEAPLVDTGVPVEIADNPIKVFAYNQVKYQWDESQWESFNKIVSQESWNWRITKEHYKGGYTKTGIKSSAFGLCGFLDSTWTDMGYEKTDDPYTQISACVKYISQRYGNPKNAWKFHTLNNWY